METKHLRTKLKTANKCTLMLWSITLK